jgi:hypothetical protein
VKSKKILMMPIAYCSTTMDLFYMWEDDGILRREGEDLKGKEMGE